MTRDAILRVCVLRYAGATAFRKHALGNTQQHRTRQMVVDNLTGRVEAIPLPIHERNRKQVIGNVPRNAVETIRLDRHDFLPDSADPGTTGLQCKKLREAIPRIQLSR